MDWFDLLVSTSSTFTPLILTSLTILVCFVYLNGRVRKRWQNRENMQFRFQLIMLFFTFIAGLSIVVALPISDTLRAQLLSLIGIVLSASIALSSTTFISNILAGIMLRVVKSVKPGDFVTVDQINGRVSEMGLLHTEVQTEDRDLVTVPNSYMVAQPLKVVRATGTIISAEVSLGYDVPRSKVERLLKAAAETAKLSEPFVQVRELGDFSVVYRIAGLLVNVGSLISARSRLREAMLDSLHEAGVEIVSPNFMNTRPLDVKTKIIPKSIKVQVTTEEATPEDVAFDKANSAALIEKLRSRIQRAEEEIAALDITEYPEEHPFRKQREAEKEALIQELATEEDRHKKTDSEEPGVAIIKSNLL